jgi:hypothetical protein
LSIIFFEVICSMRGPVMQIWKFTGLARRVGSGAAAPNTTKRAKA